MATRVTREQLDVGYTPDSTVRVTRMVIETLQSASANVAGGASRTIVVVAAG